MVQYTHGIFRVLFERGAYQVYRKGVHLGTYDRLGLAIRRVEDERHEETGRHLQRLHS